MRSVLGTLVVVMGALSLGHVLPIQAQEIYSWVEKDGTVHFADSLTAVPAKHRKAARSRADAGELVGDGKGGNYNKIPGTAGDGSAPPDRKDAAEEGVRPPGPVPPKPGAPGAKVGAPKPANAPAKAAPPVAPPAPVAPPPPAAPSGPSKEEQAAKRAKAQAELKQIEDNAWRTRTVTPWKVQETENRKKQLEAEIAETGK